MKAMSQPFSQESEQAMYALATQAYEGGDYLSALSLFRLLTLQQMNDRDYWMGLGASLQMARHYDEALMAYHYAAHLNDEDPYLFYQCAQCHEALGNLDKGYEALVLAIDRGDRRTEWKELTQQLKQLQLHWLERLK